MESCHSGDHFAEDYIQTNITKWNTEEPQHMYRLG